MPYLSNGHCSDLEHSLWLEFDGDDGSVTVDLDNIADEHADNATLPDLINILLPTYIWQNERHISISPMVTSVVAGLAPNQDDVEAKINERVELQLEECCPCWNSHWCLVRSSKSVQRQQQHQISLYLPSSQPSPAPLQNATAEPQSDEFYALLDILEPILAEGPTFDNRTNLHDPASVEYQVLDWMANDESGFCPMTCNSTSIIPTVYWSGMPLWLPTIAGKESYGQINSIF